MIVAINMAEGKWIDGPTPHPSVKEVAALLGNPAITKDEIVAIIEKHNIKEGALENAKSLDDFEDDIDED